MNEIEPILAENARRNAMLAVDYDPVAGIGCCGARRSAGGALVPAVMLEARQDYAALPAAEQDALRVRYDFEYWAATRATIVDKVSGQTVAFRLNAPQRRLLAAMERQRSAGQPVRIILLKARQWGGSTLVQLYMAWLQLEVHTGWNSLICGHRQNASRGIRRMYRRLLAHYPASPDTGRPPALRNVEGSSEVQQLDGRDCLVIIATARSEDAVRGYNIAMAHLTEVAFWPQSPMHSPDDVIRSVAGTVMPLPDSVVILESTANGTGNFFHSEWLRAKAGKSDKAAVFVPWYEIEHYRSPVTDAASLWRSLDDYERRLWNEGCTLEMIQWYRSKRREYATHAQMMAEFPSNDIEAFSATDLCVFDLGSLEALRRGCRPAQEVGDVHRPKRGIITFTPAEKGPMQVWRQPDPAVPAERYLVCVDVGGRSDKADWSVIAVLDLHDRRSRLPEVVAQWRGHIDHDLLADKALQIAQYYRNALLVIESNTLETEYTELDSSAFVLARLAKTYRHLYHRRSGDRRRRPGFHTNARTKQQAVYTLIQAVREGLYIERDHQAVDEMTTYELTPRGGFEAKQGFHDDILMTRAIALTVADSLASGTSPLSAADKHILLDESLPPTAPAD